MGPLETVAVVVALMLSLPASFVALECFAAFVARRRVREAWDASRPPAAILIPANNEEDNLGATLRSVTAQMRDGDRLIVVADNCEDDTALVGREGGAEVVERTDTERRGKGFALARGLEEVDRDPRPIVVMLDADCGLDEGTLDRLVEAAHSRQEPVQGSYLILPPTTRGFNAVSAFAIVVKNHARPLGLAQLGAPCLLTGSGMAFPRETLADVKLGTANIVEDCQLGIDLALQGCAPSFVPDARIESRLPDTTTDAVAQRRRWEHGLASVARREVPRLLSAGLRRFDIRLIALAFELSVPPLALLIGMTMGAAAVASALGLAFGVWSPAIVLGAAFAALAVSLMASWARFARRWVPWTALLSIPWYMVRKVPLYLGLMSGREQQWLRVARRAPGTDGESPR